MKKLLSICLPCAFLLMAVVFGICMGTGFIKNVSKPIKSTSEPEPLTYDELQSVEFSSLDEYIDYVTQEATAEYSDEGAPNNEPIYIQYYAPRNLPEEVEIINIRVNEQGTMFTYSLRDIPQLRDSLLYVDTDDETVIELLNMARTRIYYTSGMTNKYTYAARLANAIGAIQCNPGTGHPYCDIYLGMVKVNVQQSDGTYQQETLGQQRIKIGNTGEHEYQYFPLTLPSSLADRLELELCTVPLNGSNNE